MRPTSSGPSRPAELPSPAPLAEPLDLLKGRERSDDPIAIVGMACRFPMAPDLDAFWRLLIEGVDAVTEVPGDRWDAAALADPDPTATGKMNTRWGGFLEQVDRFDPSFFGVSPREASQMDPQQRLMLELTWEALEDAHLPPGQLRGSCTGVFTGCLFTDHALLQDRAGREAITAHTSTGGAACIIANRVSYAFDLQGPSMTVDTASSSSLVAVHLACQSLKSGESQVAIAGGVNVMLVPETTMGMTRLNTMSSDGRCRAFDARGTGYVRSEGAGALILKRLPDALRDGDRIYAVVRGSAVNNDGASDGLTAPNPVAQRALLRAAAAAAKVAPRDIHYVEAHGTGTPLGDPIEVSALGAVYGPGRPTGHPLLIGSVKTGLGHLEAAAGVAGLIKVALSMDRDALPPSLHFETPNPHIDFAGLEVEVVTRVRRWPAPEGKPRCAGVSSFGYGGTNSHLILESLPRPAAALSLIEAGSSESLEAAVELAIAALDRGALPDTRVLRAEGDGSGVRLAVVASTADRLRERLLAARAGAQGRGIFRGRPEGRRRLVWVFSGQGSQWEGMGRSLALGEPVFRAALVRCERALLPHLGWSVLDEILAGAPRATPDRIDILWPVLFAFQIALAALLRDLGVEPDVVFGHSIGEVSAAHVAGALSREDAARIIAAQARLVQRATGAHGPQMAFLVDELPGQLAAVRPRRARIPFISSVAGAEVPGASLDAAYWSRQLHEPVLFATAVARLLDEGPSAFLELAPHPIVQQSVEACARDAGRDAPAMAALRRGDDEARALREAVGVLFAAGVRVAPGRGADAGRAHVLPVSGQIDPALREAARRLADRVEHATDVPLHDLCFTASALRTHHRVRGAVTGRSRAEIVDGLRAVADRREHPAAHTGVAPLDGRPGLVFVFPGQGSQWVGMGRALLAGEGVFRASIEACDAVIRRESGFSVLDEIAADEGSSQLGRIEVVQPMLFAMEVALARLWRALGVEPDAVIGHSMGEVAAAHVAGALSLEDAATILCRRSRLLGRVAGRGAMALVELTLGEAERALDGYDGRLSVAVNNGPRSTVISGDPGAIDEVIAKLEREGVFCRRIKVDVASHSPQMDPLVEDLAASLAGIRPQPASLGMRSTVTGELVSGEELDAGYWVKNLRMPVLFGQAVARSIQAGQTLFVEISPHPLLLHAIEEGLSELAREGAAIPSLRRHEDERRCLVDGLAALHVCGHELRWDRLFPRGGRRVALPPYAWQRERYRLGDDAGSRAPARASALARVSSTAAPRPGPGAHPLLGTGLLLSVESPLHLWEHTLSGRLVPYLSDHRVQGEAVFPAAGYIEMALAAAAEAHGQALAMIEEVTFERALPAPEEEGRRVQVVLLDEGPGRARFHVSSRELEGKDWIRHAAGALRLGVEAPPTRVVRERRPRVIQARCKTRLDAPRFYQRMHASGLTYGRSFQSVAEIWLGPGEALARVTLPAECAAHVSAYQVHPVLLDACFQVLMGIHVTGAAAPGETHGLRGLHALRLFRALGQESWVHAQMRPGDGEAIEGDISVIDADGRSHADIQGLRIARLEGGNRVHRAIGAHPEGATSSLGSGMGHEQHEADGEASRGDLSFPELLARRPPSERLAHLERHILEHVGQVLRLDVNRIDRLSSFTSLGMDSVLRLELRHKLESSLRLRLSTTLLSAHPNPASFAEHLLRRIHLSPGSGAAAPGGSSAERAPPVSPGPPEIEPPEARAQPAGAASATETPHGEELARAEDHVS